MLSNVPEGNRETRVDDEEKEKEEKIEVIDEM